MTANDNGRPPAPLHRLERVLVGTNEVLVIGLMAGMSVLVITNVISRYLFNHSFVWAEELSRYMMIWVGFLGSGLVLRIGAHIAVDVFQDLMPTRIAQLMRLGVLVVMLVCIVAMGWLGQQYVQFAWGQETPVLNWNFGLVYLAIPLGAVLMLLHLVLIAGSYVRDRAFRKDGALSGQEATL
jgi:TRAP-type C4-dicarboxylate transport system permease small subunit